MAFTIASFAVAQEEVRSFKELEEEALVAYRAGRPKEAFSLVNRAIASEPANPRGYLLRGKFHAVNHEPSKAIADYDQCLKLNPRLPDAWQQRGIEQFKLGRIEDSIVSFDQFIELVPQQAAHHWQRGISLYYAGRFDDGRKQFESHQTVNPNDVENAAWHFLCVARASSVEKARTALIPVQGDKRVPMMQIHALFADTLKPEDVLKAARAGDPSKPQLNRHLFYAHLYLGLYFEAVGDAGKAREHIGKAAGEYQTGDYMGDIARVHLQLRWPEINPDTGKKKSP
jgi:lipoprotein NlpI